MIVTDGIVHYFGTVDSDDQHGAARVAAENVPGVRRAEDHRVPFRRVALGLSAEKGSALAERTQNQDEFQRIAY